MHGRDVETMAKKGAQRRLGLPFALALALGLSLVGPALPAHAADRVAEVLSVTASSADGMLMDAVDGDAATGWQNKREGEREAWIAFSFAGPVRLKGLRLHSPLMGPDVTIDVECSADGNSYSAVSRGLKVTSDRAFGVVFTRPVTAEVVRLRFRAGGSKPAPRFRLREMEALLSP